MTSSSQPAKEHETLAAGVTVSGQLDESGLSRLAQAGVGAVINNRPDGEAPDQVPSETLQRHAARLGLAYHHMPIASEADDLAVGTAMREAAARHGRVHLFCRTGRRSARAWRAAGG